VAHLRPDREDPTAWPDRRGARGRGGGPPFYGCIQPTGSQAWIKVYTRAASSSSGCGPRLGLGPGHLSVAADAAAHAGDVRVRRDAGVVPDIYEKTHIFLAGFKSGLEHNGAPVALSEVGNWTSPELVPSRLGV